MFACKGQCADGAGKRNGNGMNVTLLGTGLMGFPMACNIANAGHPLTVWNRSIDKADPLAARGVAVAQTPAQAVAQADVVISVVTDGTAVRALIDDRAVRDALRPGVIWIDMSSTRPEEGRAAQQTLQTLDVGFLDAPVSGGTKGAQDGTLAIMVGGTQPLFDAALPVLRCMGRAMRVGPTGAGQLAKLANQAIVGVTIAAVAEATLLLEQGGADAAAVRAALKGGFADSTILQQHGARMSARDFTPGAPSRIQLKDLNNVLAEADTLDLPIVRHVAARFTRYVDELDGGARDHAGLFEELLHRNTPND